MPSLLKVACAALSASETGPWCRCTRISPTLFDSARLIASTIAGRSRPSKNAAATLLLAMPSPAPARAAAAKGSTAAQEATASPAAEPTEATEPSRAPPSAADVRVPAPPSEDRRDDPEEEEKQNREEKGDGQRRPLAFPVRPSGTLVFASRGFDRGGDPRGNPAAVIARPETRKHLLVQHLARERVWHCGFEPVAHLESRLPRLGEDEKDHPVLPLLPSLPRLPARDRIFLERGSVRDHLLRVYEELIGRLSLEILETTLEPRGLVGRDHAGFVRDVPRRRRREPTTCR